mgnify:FL=1
MTVETPSFSLQNLFVSIPLHQAWFQTEPSSADGFA